MANENGSSNSDHPGGTEQDDRNDPVGGGEPYAADGIIDGDGTPGNPRDPSAAVKRGRGRPRKDGSNGTGSAASGHEGTGGGEKLGKKSTKLDVELFAKQLVGFHQILVKLTKNPLFAIDQKEAEMLSIALKDVMVLHSINISPSTLAYIKLLGACAAIYGPRVAIYSAAMAAEKKAKNTTFDAATGAPVT